MPSLLRLHDPDNFWKGVYSCSAQNWDAATMGALSSHPTPRSDGLGRDLDWDQDFHGFADEAQLLRWFPRPHEFTGRVILSIVDVNCYTMLDNQVIFRRDDYINHATYEGPLQCNTCY